MSSFLDLCSFHHRGQRNAPFPSLRDLHAQDTPREVSRKVIHKLSPRIINPEKVAFHRKIPLLLGYYHGQPFIAFAFFIGKQRLKTKSSDLKRHNYKNCIVPVRVLDIGAKYDFLRGFPQKSILILQNHSRSCIIPSSKLLVLQEFLKPCSKEAYEKWLNAICH